MSNPNDSAASKQSGGWFDGMLESTGEIVGGAVDVVGDFGKEWLGIKMGNELDNAKSSNPDENRRNNNDYQQPNGKPVANGSQGINRTPVYVALGVGALLLVVLLVVLLRGGK